MSAVLREYTAFLDVQLPSDYDERYGEYRQDAELRSAFQTASFEHGWLMPDWPEDVGGRDLPLTDTLAIRIEGARRRVPRLMNVQGAGVIAPALRSFGTSAQQRRYLEPTLRGDAWWALGMSEPGAGSDLASLRTSARLDGDVFRVSGQKVWTTQADDARWGMMYVRTDPDAPRHRGITCLLMDMDSDGIDVRPIRTAGEAIESFCEVFLDEVVVPAANVLGHLHGGWKVAMSALEHERDMIWINNWMEMQRALEPVLRQGEVPEHALADLGALLADTDAIALSGIRSVGARLSGGDASISTILKLFGSESVQAASRFALNVSDGDPVEETARFDEYLESLAATIYGGTSEIQRNIIAERVLGMPRVSA